MNLKGLISLSLFLVAVKCSENVKGSQELEKPKLIRQCNTPRSQSFVASLSGSVNTNNAKDYPEYLNLDDAWKLYLQGQDALLLDMISREGFHPDTLIEGWSTLLNFAIEQDDLRLVEMLLKVPGIDVNYYGASGLLPLELALNHPAIFNTLLSECPQLDILKPNLFGANAIQRAVQLGYFAQAEQLLNRVRLNFVSELNEDQRRNFLKLEKEFGDALEEHRLKIRQYKIKID